ncbi:hypothetical protein SprV_0200537000 [Sparganum proliferum]
MANTEILQQVSDGYRMPCPNNCPSVIYAVMLRTWEEDPNKRPSFASLRSYFEDYFAAQAEEEEEAVEATAKSAEMPASVDVRELCQALMSVLETRQSSTDTLPLLKPGDNFDVWHSQANVHLASVTAKDRARYICRNLSSEALTKASAFGVEFDTDVESLLSALRRVFASPKPPVDAYRQFSSRLQLPGESARDYLGCLRPLVLATSPDQPASLTDVVLAAHFRAGLLDDNLRRKLIKKPNLSSEALLTLVQEYEERYGHSVAAPCYSTSVARKRQTRPVATQTFRNFTCPFRGRQARVAQISSESYPVPAVTSPSDSPASIVNATVVDRRVAFLVDTGAACSLLNPQGFTRTWLQQTEISHRHPRIVAANGMPLSCSSLVDVPFRLSSSEFTHPFYVCPDIQWQGILGAEFLYAHRFCVDFAAGQLTSKSTTIPFYFPHAPDPQLFCDPVGLHPPQPSDLVHLVPDSPGFSSEQITAVRNLIFQNSAAFAWDGEPLGRTNVLQHTIDTGSARPIRQPPRRVPVHFQKQLEQTNKDMLDKHVIRPSSSPWASPIVLVKKKDGSLRLCVDYRKLNAVTVKDSFPLPRIDTTLEALAGAACFSTLDLQSGYWQVEMAPEDRPKTAFSIPSGKQNAFNWSDECERSFEELKRRLISPPLLAFPSISESAPPFILDTDASDVAIGAVFSQQLTDGLEHPLIFASQTLTKPERSDRSTRSLQADLLEYSYTVIYRAGKKHQDADALSRRAQTPPPAAAYAPATAITLGTPDHSGWASAQASDPYISLIYDRLRQGAPKPSSEEMKGSSWEARCLWSAWNSLRLCDGVLFLQYSPTDSRRLVLPHDVIHPTLSRLHADLGHAGQARTDTAARQRFWCSNQRRIIQDICNTCPVCAEVKNPNPIQRAPLQPIQAGYPNEIVGVDLMGPMPPSPRGNRYILVLVDFFTKWCEAVPLPQADAITVAKAILSEWICRHGVPERLHSDQGAQFESRLMGELCKLLHIRKSRSTPWHPQGNGQVERTNRTLRGLIQSFVNGCPDSSWDVALPQCLLAYRSATHSSTGHTPFALMYGREVRLPLDTSCPLPLPSPEPPHEFVRNLRANLYRTHELARTYLSTAHQRQKEYYDRRAHGAPYQPGDKVFWFQDRLPPGSADKFSTHWIGPFVVVEVPSEALCILRASDDPEGPTFAAHFNKLKPYALDDNSCGPVSSELPSFPSAELPHPPTDPSSIVSVPSSPPAPAVPTSHLSPVLCPRWFLVL